MPSAARPPSTGTTAPLTNDALSSRRDDLGHLGRPAGAAERVDLRQRRVERGVVALGDDRAERDGVGADPARAVVDGQRAREPLDRRLGRGVRQRAGDGALRLVRGDVDDRARDAVRAGTRATAARAPATAGARLAAISATSVRGRHVVQRRVAEDRGVVDPAAQLRPGELDGRARARASSPASPTTSAGPSQVDGDHTSVVREALGDRAADPASASRDDERGSSGTWRTSRSRSPGARARSSSRSANARRSRSWLSALLERGHDHPLVQRQVGAARRTPVSTLTLSGSPTCRTGRGSRARGGAGCPAPRAARSAGARNEACGVTTPFV